MTDRYLAIRKDVDTIAKECGRDPAEITIVAVSKGYSWDQVKSAYEAGCRVFFECKRIKRT